MKKTIALLMLSLLLVGCSDLKGSLPSEEESAAASEPTDGTATSLGSDSDTSVEMIDGYPVEHYQLDFKIEMSEKPMDIQDDWLTADDVEAAKPRETIVFDNGRENYTDEEAAEIINKIENFTVSEDFHSEVPKHLDHISEMTVDETHLTDADVTPKEKLKHFLEVYKYLFPDNEFYPEYMYLGGSYDLQLYKHYDDFLKQAAFEEHDSVDEGANSYPQFFYGDLSYAYQDEVEDNGLGPTYVIYEFEGKVDNPIHREDSVLFCTGYPLGCWHFVFNRGVAGRIACDAGVENNPLKDVFSPENYFECVGAYLPDSEESFKLLDKEVKIKDATAFFENYINTLPGLNEPVVNLKVREVLVYKLNDDSYGYYYNCSREYDEIPFNYGLRGSISGYAPMADICYGFMVYSDEVDFAYHPGTETVIVDEKQYTDMIPFEEAIKIASEKLTEHVNFEVKSASIVYDLNMGTDSTGRTVYPAHAAWKFVMYNKNDNLYYTCYLNARDRDKFNYSTSSAD